MSERDEPFEGDPAEWGTPEGRRMLDLLWNPPEPAARGPKQRLTVSQVVDAGMAVAARDGVDKLSMRNVAAELGVGTMSLYTYVPGRDELYELMIDRAYAVRTLPDPSLPWREQLLHHVRQGWAMFQTYPWMIRSNLWRMPLGPHVMDVQEDIYRAVLLTRLPAPQVVEISGLVESHVFGIARSAITDTSVAATTGMTADDYWESRASFWATYYSAERFPSMTQLWESGAFDATPANDEFEFSTRLLLDGVEQLVRESDTSGHK